jgi:signal transduction histidine kinase/FixJ family two-component response regulator
MVDRRKTGFAEASSDLRMLNEFALAMLEPHTLEQLLWNMADRIGTLLAYDDCVIYLREGDVLVQAAAFGVKNASQGEINERIVIPLGEGIVGEVAVTGIPEFVRDTREDPRYISDQFDGSSEMAVPLRFEGVTLGVLDTEGASVDAFNDEDFARFQAIANIAAGRIAWLRSERSRQRAEDQHQAQRLESLGMLAGGIAHDFNNLLAVLSMNLELARIVEDPAEITQALDTMEQALDRARGLTKQLMTFGSGGAPLRELAELPPLVLEAIRFIEVYPGIDCQLSFDEELPIIQADVSQVGQVLHNLLINAVQAMKGAGRIDIDIRRVEGREGPRVVLRVSDDGPGVPPSVASRIFDPFYSTKQHGTGLGLAICYWIIARHDGDLTIESGPERGTVFRIELPGVEGRIARSDRSSVQPSRSLRVLVLDDVDDVRKGVCRLLNLSGHETQEVADGSDVAPTWARARSEGQPFDLALLDLANPSGVDGVEAMQLLRALDPDATAIVMSGYSEQRVMSEYAEHGFAARIEKPFRRIELDALLARVMNGEHESVNARDTQDENETDSS